MVITSPLSEKLRYVSGYREITNFFMKSYFRIKRIRDIELDLCIHEYAMQSTRIFRILSQWKNRKEQELWKIHNS